MFETIKRRVSDLERSAPKPDSIETPEENARRILVLIRKAEGMAEQ